MARGWWIVFGALLAVAALLPFDGAASAAMLQQVGPHDDPPVLRRDQFNLVLGLIFGSAPFCYVLIILGSFPKPLRRVQMFLAALIGSALVTHLLKILIGRARPDTGLGAASFAEEALHEVHGSMQSYPSGHATTAVCLGLLLARYFPSHRYLIWLGAANICIERMISERHFLSDVLGGAAVALLTVWACLQRFGRDATDLEPGTTPPRPTRHLLISGVALLAVSLTIFGQAALGGTWDLQAAAVFGNDDVRQTYALVGAVIGTVVGLAILHAILTRFRNGYALLFGLFVAVTASTALLHLLKFSIGRARPLVENAGPFAFEPLRYSQTMNAFPSGHTTFNVMMAILLSCWFPRGRWYFFFVAAAIMLERVVNQFHWPSDLAGGVALATATFLVCYRLLGRRRYIPERDATITK